MSPWDSLSLPEAFNLKSGCNKEISAFFPALLFVIRLTFIVGLEGLLGIAIRFRAVHFATCCQGD